MEVYTLDTQLRRAEVIDRFESLIWTERFSAWGDFELHVLSTPEMRRLLPAGTRLAMNESHRVMTVELVENTTDSDGRAMLKLTGRSLEAMMDERTARNTFVSLGVMPKWTITGTPGDIARTIFNAIMRTNTNFPEDQLPFLAAGTLFPPGNIEEPGDVITIELGLGSVYKAIQEICSAYNLGFRILRDGDNSRFFFDIYSGNDRTTLQAVLDPVVFAPELDNLTDISEITATGNYRNVAHVFHPVGVQIVTSDGTPVEVSGFDRRILSVDASDIETLVRPDLSSGATSAISAALQISSLPTDVPEGLRNLQGKIRLTSSQNSALTSWVPGSSLTTQQKSDLTAAQGASWAFNTTEDAYILPLLQQRGKDELAKHRPVQAFDGEIPPNSPYRYELHYQLGDLLEMRNSDGVTNQMRATEQIFVSDTNGERSYPTLTIDRFITPGSWLAWDYNQTWSTADGTWSEA